MQMMYATVPKAQPPVQIVAACTCCLDLSGLPDEYSGGFGVSNTLAQGWPSPKMLWSGHGK